MLNALVLAASRITKADVTRLVALTDQIARPITSLLHEAVGADRNHPLNACLSLLAQANAISDHPPGEQRDRHAEIFVRQAMYERTVGRITAEQESRIFSLLSFAMPDEWRALHPTPAEMLTEGPSSISQPETDTFSLACEPKS